MDMKQLDILAKDNEQMPNTLNWYETAYYQSSRCLYRQYDMNTITVEAARKEKRLIIQQYQENMKEHDFLIHLHSIEVMLHRLSEQGFNTVLEEEILEEINKALK